MAQDNVGSLAVKAAASGAIKAFAYHATITYVIPIGIPVLTAYAGYAQNLPWMYVLLGGGLMFAAITTGLVRLDDWREKRRVDGKLGFIQTRSGAEPKNNSVVLGALFQSTASIPLEVEVEEVRTQVGNLVPTNRVYQKTKFVIQPHGTLFFDDHAIQGVQYPRSDSLTGTLEYRLRYGRVGNMKYVLTIKKNAALNFDADGRYTSGSWTDAI